MNSWDYARVFKQDAQFSRVQNMRRFGLTWEEIHRRLPGLFKRHMLLRQQFNKELYRRTYKEVTGLLHSQTVSVAFMTDAGWSTDMIASALDISERTVARERGRRRLLPSRTMLQAYVRDLRAIQLGGMSWEGAKNLLLDLFPQTSKDITQPEVRAWSDALDLFEEELNEVLDG